MRTIVVTGSYSNVGKTLMAEWLLKQLPGWSALKVTVRHNREGGRRYKCPRNKGCSACTDFKGDFDVVTDRKIIDQKGKDTARLKKAGAKRVAWLRSTSKGLKRGLKKAFLELKDSEGLVIEGASVLKYLKPDIAIYMKGRAHPLKRSAEAAQKKADIVINLV
ncbi:MAG: hypothetical protein ABH875_00075 [Candidatus Omnitrophota bacterium]